MYVVIIVYMQKMSRSFILVPSSTKFIRSSGIDKFCPSAQWHEGPPLITKMSFMHHVILKSKIFL